jgi:hypothetical protein
MNLDKLPPGERSPGIGRKRARLAIDKPKFLRLAGIAARPSPANLRAARGGIEKHRHLIVAAIMRLARPCGETTLAIAGHRPFGSGELLHLVSF